MQEEDMKNFIATGTVRDLPLFSELSTEDLRKIVSFSLIKRFKKSEIVFLDGDRYSGFYIVCKGMVKLYKLSESGNEAVLHFVTRFASFAEVPLFEGKQVYPANAMALEDCVLLFIPQNEFLQFVEQQPKICLKIIAGFAQKLRVLTNRIEDLTSREINSRLAKFLISEMDNSRNKQGGNQTISIILRTNKTALAGFLGTITETLSRSFAKLQRDGVITVQGKIIDVINLTELKKIAGLKF